jgi:hypothetical protein
MRLVRRVSVIKLRECTHTMLADILEESLSKIFRTAIECLSHHLEAYVDVWCKKVRERTSLVICEVTVNL